jgi:Domain of unknown function (DUF6134)
MSRLSNGALTRLAYALVTLWPMSAYTSTEQQWKFKVYLDDTPIGYHNFSVKQADGSQSMSSRAHFDVTFLRISLFKYRHRNVEEWSNRCLNSISSTTDQNGTLYRVEGSMTDTGFRISTNEEDVTLPSCISTFAYWDKSFLQHTRLLNSQTGEYLVIDVEHLGKQSIMVKNSSIPADHYRLTADELDIELWYANDGQWLGLESTTAKGQRLRYVVE